VDCEPKVGKTASLGDLELKLGDNSDAQALPFVQAIPPTQPTTSPSSATSIRSSFSRLQIEASRYGVRSKADGRQREDLTDDHISFLFGSLHRLFPQWYYLMRLFGI